MRARSAPAALLLALGLGGALHGAVGGFAVRTNRQSGLRTWEVGVGALPVFLLHGYGSSPTEFLPFAGTIRLGADRRFVFPEAPEATVAPDGPPGGRAWWRLDLASYLRRGEPLPDLSGSRPPGLEASQARVRLLLGDVRRRLGGPPQETVLGGFSQGAMVAADLAFRTDEPMRALVILSGTIVDEAAWDAGMARRRGLPVFVSHGRQDPVLRFESARRLEESMRRAGLSVTFVPFDGGHEIPASVVSALNEFLVRAGAGPRAP